MKNSAPSSEFEDEDKCPSCGSPCDIHTDLDENDECNQCGNDWNIPIIPKETPKTTNKMTQTAVEFYAEEFAEHLEEVYSIKIKSLTLLAKAKAIEKQQIIDAFYGEAKSTSILDGEEYYDKTFKNK